MARLFGPFGGRCFPRGVQHTGASRFALALCFGLAACSNLPSLGLPEDGADVPEDRRAMLFADASRPPALRPGDSFTYDNPETTWQVLAHAGDGTLAWQATDGSTQLTDANPLMPALQWHTPNTGSGRRFISQRTEPLFPLEIGKTIRFRSTVDTDAPPYAWEYDWTCEVLPIEEVIVPAGTFLTFPVLCGRGTGDDATFYYSPDVGNYVRVSIADPDGGPPVARNLLAFSRSDGFMRLADAETAPEVGEVVLEESEDGAPIMSSQPGADQMGDGIATADEDSGGTPMALGMLSGIEPAPSESPQSSLMVDGTSESMADTGSSGLSGSETMAATAGTASGDGVADGRTVAVHLASYLNPDNAEAGWNQLMSNNRDQLNGTRPMIRQVDLGSQGIFFRLHAGPLSGESQAQEICRVLESRGIYCQVTRL